MCSLQSFRGRRVDDSSDNIALFFAEPPAVSLSVPLPPIPAPTPPKSPMSLPMYDSYSPAPPLGDVAPAYYQNSSKAIFEAESRKSGLAALGETVGGSLNVSASQSTLAPKYTRAGSPSGRALARRGLIDDYVRKEVRCCEKLLGDMCVCV